MNKKLWFIIVFIAVIGVAWYLISPAFITVEVNEESPLNIKDSMLDMDEREKAEFDFAVDEMKEEVIEMNDKMNLGTMEISHGLFKARAHDVKGEAILIDDRGTKILRFENFETINGPNLHIYLASNLGDDDFIDLGKIKATKGNVNYDIPKEVDTEKYDKVLIWCVPFGVLFSYAELES